MAPFDLSLDHELAVSSRRSGSESISGSQGRAGWQRSGSGHGAEPLLDQSEERWDEEDVDGTRQQHAADYGGAHDLARY